ncbi:bacteriohemerythrin [Candidatus Venteria ishoeyi]|uniref:Bacteriohemerythrin n=1 Tax=Candidatus Venteria ishoeyi TaxID=1899563 RepID=A0A1H6FIT6_9GAMM|nr:hemerythrin family protein [Candidatus Venteria ishoeyi]MDM8546779.1 hemerythrin family protein [Candidatus Venteria ishoeyi]SEH09150.1 Bacteriohemerythrin [Candidatus Venteria ishoeyi]SEH09279.1 Bacteriohemerythrin [Candidatus Venteria ishoeyi]
MPLFLWNEKYSVGNARMDRHHKKMLNLLDKLYEAARQGQGQNVIEDVIKKLGDYTQYHFQEEEALMARINYPDLPAHKAAHQAFIADFEKLRQDIHRGNVDHAEIKLSNMIATWWKKHVLKMDKQYKIFIKNQNKQNQ